MSLLSMFTVVAWGAFNWAFKINWLWTDLLYSVSDIDECSLDFHLCVTSSEGGMCSDSDGSYTCSCSTGYRGNGVQNRRTVGTVTGTGCTGKQYDCCHVLRASLISLFLDVSPIWLLQEKTTGKDRTCDIYRGYREVLALGKVLVVRSIAVRAHVLG